jgi:hypothetical protein
MYHRHRSSICIFCRRLYLNTVAELPPPTTTTTPRTICGKKSTRDSFDRGAAVLGLTREPEDPMFVALISMLDLRRDDARQWQWQWRGKPGSFSRVSGHCRGPMLWFQKKMPRNVAELSEAIACARRCRSSQLTRRWTKKNNRKKMEGRGGGEAQGVADPKKKKCWWKWIAVKWQHSQWKFELELVTSNRLPSLS